MTLPPEEFAVARRQIEERERARISSEAARDIVEEFRGLVEDATPRLCVAGSLRRLEDAGGARADMKDVELVALPGMLFPRLDRLVIEGAIEKSYYIDKNEHISTRWGARYRGVHFHGLRLEIFLSEEDDWGYQFWLRTGPSDVNKYVMGWLTGKPLSFKDGSGWYRFEDGEARLRIINEPAFYGLLDVNYQPPEFRTLAETRRWLTRLATEAEFRRMRVDTPRLATLERATQLKLF